MKKLIAKRPVLYMGMMYQAGDRLPAQDKTMVAAWLNAGSAAWIGPEAEKTAGNGQEPPATPAEDGDGHQDPQRETGAPAGQENGKEPEMVTGHLDAEDLAKMKKADLEDLAAKLGVDISKAKNNDERAALIAAVEIQAPAQETGGAQ